MAARMAIMAMTTNNSINVNAACRWALPSSNWNLLRIQTSFCREGIVAPAPPAGWRAGPARHILPYYRHKRKNCIPPETGTVTCQVLVLMSDGTFVSVIQVGLLRFELPWTENPALARGQLNTTLP